jgi:GxxExxY protein
VQRIRECHDGLFESAITERVIGAFHTVYAGLGFGFPDAVYQRAMAIEIAKRGLDVTTHAAMEVTYDDVVVGAFRADLVVESRVVVELASGRSLAPENEMQLVSHLRASGLEVGLLFHFGPRPGVKRFVGTNRPQAQSQALIAEPPPAPGPHPSPRPGACPTP